MSRRPAPKLRAMSINDGAMCLTPAWVSSAMIQMAKRNTLTTMVLAPMPNRIISTGTSADSGALAKTLTHMPSRFSAAFTRPISTPSATPHTIASTMPMQKVLMVVQVAVDLVGRAGAVDLRRDDLRHLPRAAGQQHDAVGQVDRFLDAVGHEDEGL